MKTALLALALALPTAAFADVTGTWKTQTSDTGAYLLVDVKPCSAGSDLICGWIKEAKNTENQGIVGKAIIKNMAARDGNRWHKGTIWAPDDDKTYKSKMELNGDVLKVEGCVAIICRGQNWTRVK
ncbi:DUF2147 domain-containing protein [Oceanomicrobium pacificus]|uniref:DUF2147 domain-containing protein n=1 Tax=Oceanomicrobium pacificus TaxID=2692916 RepID=A0A6B0TSB5_9RHOB|nr:DUF2147 domain-containing protein [Oceanomicrobium pacificus]MXU63903.1 DUF2147 domain-containing protein [Oceanomicrobium pacificus]